MSVLAPTNQAPLARPLSRPGFFSGLASLLGGFGFIIARPNVWGLALVPVLIAFFVSAAFTETAISYVPKRLVALFGATSEVATAGAWVASVIVTALVVVVGIFVALAITQPLSGPALNAIVRRVEWSLGITTRRKATSFYADWATGLGSLLLTIAFGLPIFALLFLINFVFPAAVVVTVPLKLVALALLVAWDLCDYPLSLRGIGLRARIRFARRHALALVGFGACLAVVTLVPFAFFLVLPAGVAGAAKLTVLLERFDESRGLRLE
jgi:CysZ protein